MDFRNARARQPEIVRSVQKDLNYTNELAGDLSDVLRLTGPRNWIKYNQYCQLLAEITYHGFSAVHSLQTLGEEYTGIIQVDSQYRSIPSSLLQLSAIILEFGGELLYARVLAKLERHIEQHDEIVPEAKQKLLTFLCLMRSSSTYMKALHKSLFYLRATKYQISKRVTGINYVLIRHWLQPEFSLYGYRILGVITLLQVSVSLAVGTYESWMEQRRQWELESSNGKSKFLQLQLSSKPVSPGGQQCILCLEPRISTSLTPCGHLFCWPCILEWLDERDECPLCRETVKKSNVIQLRNYL